MMHQLRVSGLSRRDRKNQSARELLLKGIDLRSLPGTVNGVGQ